MIEPLTPETPEETEAKRARACNYAPIDRPMELPTTVAGVSILGIEIANASGLQRREGFWERVTRWLWSA